ncbi:ribosome maturation factor RimP [Candidatus Liberibacter solanacearum]|uniref:Ribosome maturation factor RimP n=1 Tax=Candidatus Liberibacter solanacearum TaxID=556287 RepID=A0A1V2N874_9HYPH|nr:ribosome maturation factor RimP [Candidatus Liberibacter solanacearum]ONI59174.1 ribosome assembly cofactor RimP [Candidatus Liberibacter solanacearum]ONI59883.1 ribosome assembly cofactor RimP [Candidatus Liberibacter solanacearum]
MESTHVFCSKYEPRIFEDVGLGQDVSNIIQPVIEEMGFRIVQVSLLEERNLILQILVERDNGTMTLCDCEEVSKAISPILDVENIIEEHYQLEISSPGINRPMVRKSDFERWNGHIIACEVSSSSGDKKKLVGKIIGKSDLDFFLEKKEEDLKDAGVSQIAVSFDSLLSAKLVITDELLCASLNRK